MRNKIIIAQIVKIAILGESYLRKEITKGNIESIMCNNYAMNKGSVGYYLNAYLCMRRGKNFTGTINSEAVDYYLDKILSNHGEDAYDLALQSVRKFNINIPNSRVKSVLDRHLDNLKNMKK